MKITEAGRDVLAPVLATCGGTVGPMFQATKLIIRAKVGDLLEEVVPLEAFPTLADLAERGSVLTPEVVVTYFGGKQHHAKIATEGTMVGREIEGRGLQAFAHTLLPVKDGYYRNRDIQIPLRNLVPLGPQDGPLVAHLGGVFASGCSEEFLVSLLKEQYQYLKEAKDFAFLDYELTPKLREETQKAKEMLGL